MWLGIDVGTGSARAGLFDSAGALLGSDQAPLEIDRPAPDHAEYRSKQIWDAVCRACQGALKAANVAGYAVEGIGFDATCSLVVEGGTVSDSGADSIVWMDHRALEDAAQINAGDHDVLRYVGGTISPEMQVPKLRWLLRNRPGAVGEARFFDLPDWLSFRATGSETRSLCSVVCKWTYRGHLGRSGEGWDDAFFDQIGLGPVTGAGHARIGTSFAAPGEVVGTLTAEAARELGLTEGVPVAAGLIDAYAGALGSLWAAADVPAEGRLALIGGTSACHVALTDEASFVPGVWGPYFEVILPGLWALEAGQSAAGALIDRLIAGHPAGAPGKDLYADLDARLTSLAGGAENTHRLGARRHIGPDVLGNRAPLADPGRRGALIGFDLDTSLDDLVLTYLAGLQALAHGTRQIVDEMAAQNVEVIALAVSGGLAKSPLYLREHADATGLPVIIPQAQEPVLLGAAMLARAAAEGAPLIDVAKSMAGPAQTIAPRPQTRAFHDAKQRVFRRMQQDAIAYDNEMDGL